MVSSWWDTSFITMRLIKDIDEKDTRRMGKGLEDREKECGSLLDKECKQVILLSKEHFKKSPPASYCLLRWVDISPKQCKEIGTDALFCPYFMVLSIFKETPISVGEGRLFDVRRGFLHGKKGVSSFAPACSLLTRHCCVTLETHCYFAMGCLLVQCCWLASQLLSSLHYQVQ